MVTVELWSIPPRPSGAAELAGGISALDDFLHPAEAAGFAASELVPPLLHAAGLRTPRVIEVLSDESDVDWITCLLGAHPEIDDLLVGLPVHVPVRPENRDPLIWSGVDTVFDAVRHVCRGRGVFLSAQTLHHHGNAPAATALAVQYAVFDEATGLLNRFGLRTWGGWLGKAAETVAYSDGGARWRAEASAKRVAVSEVARWLAEDGAPLLVEGRRGLVDLPALLRGAAHAVTSTVMSSERDAARRRAGGAAALALLAEIGRRAAGEISSRGNDPYTPLAAVGERLVAATTELLFGTTSADGGDRG